ncbi:MAG: hypothetical protein WA051_00780 [Minisyncoccia bacterium]
MKDVLAAFAVLMLLKILDLVRKGRKARAGESSVQSPARKKSAVRDPEMEAAKRAFQNQLAEINADILVMEKQVEELVTLPDEGDPVLRVDRWNTIAGKNRQLDYRRQDRDNIKAILSGL